MEDSHEASQGSQDFLLEFNGGTPTPDTVDVPDAPGTPTDVQVFFGIGRSVESSNLSWNLSQIAERCPGRRVLPIACDSGGNLFALKIERGVTAEVVYCDLDSSECTFYPVAPSFGEFIRRIRTYAQ
jgi:hypothetical protein